MGKLYSISSRSDANLNAVSFRTRPFRWGKTAGVLYHLQELRKRGGGEKSLIYKSILHNLGEQKPANNEDYSTMEKAELRKREVGCWGDADWLIMKRLVAMMTIHGDKHKRPGEQLTTLAFSSCF